jgi:hypothetical protein
VGGRRNREWVVARIITTSIIIIIIAIAVAVAIILAAAAAAAAAHCPARPTDCPPAGFGIQERRKGKKRQAYLIDHGF